MATFHTRLCACVTCQKCISLQNWCHRVESDRANVCNTQRAHPYQRRKNLPQLLCRHLSIELLKDNNAPVNTLVNNESPLNPARLSANGQTSGDKDRLAGKVQPDGTRRTYIDSL